MSNAIERIKGYCTEVTQAQWEELVRVADEVGWPVCFTSRKDGMIKPARYARLNAFEELGFYHGHHKTIKLIPFPDFLAKLRGVEEWTPKAGEMVEVDLPDRMWTRAEFVGMHGPFYVCFVDGEAEIDEDSYFGFNANDIRPLRPTITRAEAEQQLGKRIID